MYKRQAYNAIRDCVANGGKILFVGTKKQAQDSIKNEAERCGMYLSLIHILDVYKRQMCTRVCEADAITVENNIAKIDYSKCTGCGKCAEKCPAKIIL